MLETSKIFAFQFFRSLYGHSAISADHPNFELLSAQVIWFHIPGLLTLTSSLYLVVYRLFYVFFLCHCECQAWKYLHAIAVFQLFPEHVSSNVAWHQISSSQLYRLRICSHYYHCLCFMLFFSWGIFVCFHGYCFLHFGCSCRELRVAQCHPPRRLQAS